MCQIERKAITQEYLYELELIEIYAGKQANEVLNNYSVIELIRLFSIVTFMQHLPL